MKGKIRDIAVFLIVCLIGVSVYGQQKSRLATEYYNAGEFEKAAQLFESLYRETPANKTYFNWYITCLLDMKDYVTATRIVQQELKKNPADVALYVTNGSILERQGFLEKANEDYKKAIQNLPADVTSVTNLAGTFTNLAKYDLAIETYLKGEKLANTENLYVYYLADLYRRQGDIKNMIKYYLITAERENNPTNVQTSLQRFLGEADYLELQKQLYLKVQEKPDAPVFGELLLWTFLQKKENEKALRQAKAMDRQFDENGSRVFTLAETFYKEKDYTNAIEGYNYLILQHGKGSGLYLEARRGLLNSKKNRVTENFTYSKEDLFSLKNEYQVFLQEMGQNTRTAYIMQEYAEFEALYVNELDTAIQILEELKSFGGLNPEILATAKLSLGDYYLMKGDRWEASLLFSQVDKDFKEGDAIDMSVFILDNLGMDTTEATLRLYATADLLVFQNRFEEALQKLDSIKILFPDHSLDDDVLYSKAQIYQKLRKTQEMIAMYQAIIDTYPEEIRADNALFELAEFYEKAMKDTEKAKALYEKIFLEYTSSTYAVEAKARYRRLRGDSL
ncbi:MAG: tetratricopeptide repeat protein [Saprospiraceae bacterium]|nr:tetratricopeptide repeat protein [Saprospiraceae bacterium]